MRSDRPALALLGTGLMGAPMARRLLSAGYTLTVWNRTRDRARELEGEGATLARSPAEAVAAASGVLLVLQDGAAIESVLFETEEIQKRIAGRTILQLGTIGPDESRDFAERIAKAGGEYLEAPVLGSIPEATGGKLIVMVGSRPELFERWHPVLRALGEKVSLIGPVGHAAALKLAMNQLIATFASTYAMGLELVRSHGVAVEHYVETVRASALYSKAFDKKLPRMLQQDFSNPNFPARHMLKDVDLCLKTAESRGLGTEALEALHELFTRTLELGLADADYSAVAAAVAKGPQRATR